MNTSFFRSIKKTFVNFFSGIKIYTGGVVFFGETNYKINGYDMRQILNIIKPGDVIVRRNDHYLGNIFIKGSFSHAGLYVGNNRVIHVTTSDDGIKNEDVLTFIRADAIAIARPKDMASIATAIELAYEQLELAVNYDYDFDKDSSDEFYCSEFIDYCYGYLFKDSLPKKTAFILPDVYAESSAFFGLIWKKE